MARTPGSRPDPEEAEAVGDNTRPVSGVERDGTVAIAGRRFTWRALGDGPRLLLAQGYAGSADDWPPDFLAALGRSFALLAPDNRGMGGSDLGDPAEVTIESMAADLEALLDELEIDRIAVLGFSMGGLIAQALAVRAPERVESLALLSTDPGGPDAIRARPEDWGRLVDHSGTPRERASRMISVIFPPDVAYLPAAETFITSLDYQPVSLEAMVQALFGEINPSGKLPETVRQPPPASGVLHPFGYGLGFP
jgi:pimeloyl-ACP methyl ester carboxylesterase